MPVAGPLIGAGGSIASSLIGGSKGGGGEPEYPPWMEKAANDLYGLSKAYSQPYKRGRKLAGWENPYDALLYQPSMEAGMASLGLVRPAMEMMYKDLVSGENEYLPQGWAAMQKMNEMRPEQVLADMAGGQYGSPGEAFGLGGIGTMRSAATEDAAKAIQYAGAELLGKQAPIYERAAADESERKYRNMAAMPGVLQNLITGAQGNFQYPYSIPYQTWKRRQEPLDWMMAGKRALLTPLMGGSPSTPQAGYNPWPQVGQAFASTDWSKLLGGGSSYAPGVSPQGYNPSDPYYSMINASNYNPGNEPWASGM